MKFNITTIILFVFTSSFLFFSCDSNYVKDNSSINESSTDTSANTTEQSRIDSGEVRPAMPVNAAAVTVKVFSATENGTAGYGYDILMDGKLYVHQPHIPAVAGNRSFASEKDAGIAGELVAYKIRNNIMPPSVTVEELDSLGIK